jgi:hypothetical protein
MRTVTTLLLAIAGLLSASQSIAADRCEPVRPPGLSAGAVDEIVLMQIAEAFRLPADRIDPQKTLSQIYRSDDLWLRYAYFALNVGHALAFDSVKAFWEANKSTGEATPEAGLTVAAIEALARKAYFAGTDTPPPVVRSGATFSTHLFSVVVPARPPNWSLVFCGIDQLSFRSQDASSSEVYAASARAVSLEPYTDDGAFLAQLKSSMETSLRAKYKLISVEAKMVEGPGPPCALVSAEGPPIVPPARTLAGSRYVVLTRFCYRGKPENLGYAALFSHLGEAPAGAVHDMAMSFIDSVTAAP